MYTTADLRMMTVEWKRKVIHSAPLSCTSIRRCLKGALVNVLMTLRQKHGGNDIRKTAISVTRKNWMTEYMLLCSLYILYIFLQCYDVEVCTGHISEPPQLSLCSFNPAPPTPTSICVHHHPSPQIGLSIDHSELLQNTN